MDIGLGLLLSLMAGMSTGIGAAVALFIKKPKMTIMSFSLGLSAGVMVYISFMELLPHGIRIIGNGSILFFFAGMAVPGIIDLFIPEPELENGAMNGACETGIGTSTDKGKSRDGVHLHRLMFVRPKTIVHSEEEHKKMSILRSGIMTALAITIHNIPEGMATFSSTIHDVNLGLIITFAIVIHNIPEGVSTAMPILCATNNRKKAFYLSFLSGLAEPAGALFCALILLPFLNDQVIAGLLAITGGIMVYISLDEILPTAHKYGNGHLVIVGVVAGMAIMSISLLKF
jgi:ZIP family zinc transporter